MDYQKLFNYMSEEHGIILLQTDMQEIFRIVNEIQKNELSEFTLSYEICDCEPHTFYEWEKHQNKCCVCNKRVY